MRVSRLRSLRAHFSSVSDYHRQLSIIPANFSSARTPKIDHLEPGGVASGGGGRKGTERGGWRCGIARNAKSSSREGPSRRRADYSGFVEVELLLEAIPIADGLRAVPDDLTYVTCVSESAGRAVFRESRSRDPLDPSRTRRRGRGGCDVVSEAERPMVNDTLLPSVRNHIDTRRALSR